MGDVVELAHFRPEEKKIGLPDQLIIDALLANTANENATDACGFMSMRLYQLGIKTNDINASLDMDVIKFLVEGVLERANGLETENTLLLDTLRLHFGYQDEASQASVTEIGVKIDG